MNDQNERDDLEAQARFSDFWKLLPIKVEDLRGAFTLGLRVQRLRAEPYEEHPPGWTLARNILTGIIEAKPADWQATPDDPYDITWKAYEVPKPQSPASRSEMKRRNVLNGRPIDEGVSSEKENFYVKWAGAKLRIAELEGEMKGAEARIAELEAALAKVKP